MPRKFAEWDKIQVETDLMVRMGFLNATEEVEVNEEESTHSSDVRRRNASATGYTLAHSLVFHLSCKCQLFLCYSCLISAFVSIMPHTEPPFLFAEWAEARGKWVEQ